MQGRRSLTSSARRHLVARHHHLPPGLVAEVHDLRGRDPVRPCAQVPHLFGVWPDGRCLGDGTPHLRARARTRLRGPLGRGRPDTRGGPLGRRRGGRPSHRRRCAALGSPLALRRVSRPVGPAPDQRRTPGGRGHRQCGRRRRRAVRSGGAAHPLRSAVDRWSVGRHGGAARDAQQGQEQEDQHAAWHRTTVRDPRLRRAASRGRSPQGGTSPRSADGCSPCRPGLSEPERRARTGPGPLLAETARELCPEAGPARLPRTGRTRDAVAVRRGLRGGGDPRLGPGVPVGAGPPSPAC